ncbi:MAG: NTP transferase domain-containing protein [Armatimonadetes bacterium]|nr:NTP transferase domain-containing protein [Armatimonadota bacterium]
MTAALILAGGRLAPELVPVADGATNRALIRVGANDETMLDLVVTAVKAGMGDAGRVLVAGDVPLPGGCEAVAGGDSLVQTLMNGANALRSDETRLLIATADAPFLTSEAVADFLTRAETVMPTPFVYPLIDAQICAKAFPGMKRTTLRIAEGTFTGGNLALLDPAFLRRSESAIRAAYAQRKNVAGLAQMLGAETILRLLFSRVFPPLLAIKHVEHALGKMLQSDTPRAIITPFAGVGADVDRPEDVAFARTILAKTPESA